MDTARSYAKGSAQSSARSSTRSSGKFVQLQLDQGSRLESRRLSFREVPADLGPASCAVLLALKELTEPLRPLFLFVPGADAPPAPAAPWMPRLKELSDADDLIASDLSFERHLGEGAFATVELHRLVVDSSEARGRRLLELFPSGLVAVKRIKGGEGCTTRPELELSLRTEGALLHSLRLPTVVRSLGCITLPPPPLPGASVVPTPVLVLEYLGGGSLHEALRSRNYTAAQALGWTIDIASALQSLHGGNVPIAHRDLKPDNVVMTTSKSGGVAKLVDFGLARLLLPATADSGLDGSAADLPVPLPPSGSPGSGNASSRLPAATSQEQPPLELGDVSLRTEAGDVPTAEPIYTRQTGSERYVAPENWLGLRYDHRVDIFAFAVLAFEILSKDRAYEKLFLSSAHIADAVATRGLRPALPECWPSEIRTLLGRCWEREPLQRPDAAELYSELVAFRDCHDANELEAIFGRKTGCPCAIA
ncbi:kinase-like domain-containing protein [Pavlovales sp. CCMP2436]|nr:kinase-like domain-containing protein [Pavlovales sp. CCMP2436]